MNGIAVICGMRAEAALLPRDVVHACSGGRAAWAYEQTRRLLTEGATGLLSFGIAGGLDPALKPGALVVGSAVAVDDMLIAANASWVEMLAAALPGVRAGTIVGSEEAITYPLAKASLHKRWKALVVDMESGAVARACREAGKPFAVLRAVADPAARAIPMIALTGLTKDGRMDPVAVGRGIAGNWGQAPALIRLAGDSRRGLRALRGAARRLGPALGFEPGVA